MTQQHYFTPSPQSASHPHDFTVDFDGLRLNFTSDDGVFSKGELDKGTALLLRSLPPDAQGTLLDLGCGWGAVGVIAGKRCPHLAVTMVDVNERAVALAQKNAERNGIAAACMQSDGIAALHRSFDFIFLNPPIRAGKEVIYRLFRECAEHLKPMGQVHIVIRKQQGADSAQRFLQTLFSSVETVSRSAGFRVFVCKKG